MAQDPSSNDPRPAHALLEQLQRDFQTAQHPHWGVIKSDAEEPELWFWSDEQLRIFRVTCSRVEGEIDHPAWKYARYMLNPQEARNVAAQETDQR